MQLFLQLSLSLSLFILSTTASPVTSHAKRLLVTPADIYQDITNIHDGVLANQAAVSAFTGGNPAIALVQGGPVLATVAEIHVVNRKGYADATLSGPIDQADSQSIVDHTVNTVGVSIPNAVDIIKSKKDAFEQSGQGPVVLASLELLLNDHDTFSAALLMKTYSGDAALNAEADGVVAKIHNAIQGGIDAYST